MKSKHLVDSELAPYLDAWPTGDIVAETLAARRQLMKDMPPLAAPDAPEVAETQEFVPGTEGQPDIRVVIYRPQCRPQRLPVFFHIHGGGFVMGEPEYNGPRNRHLAQDIGCMVVSVAYRLAPETPFPGPVEDCYSALQWIYRQAERLGIDTERIAIGGESAGGGLAAALGLLARDRGEIPVSFQLLIYPMLDDRTGAANETNPHPYTGQFFWTAASNRFGWTSMLGAEPGGLDVSPYASPSRAASVANLPPTFISVGSLDLFVEENIEFARRLIRAGVPTDLHVYAGGFHGLDMISGTNIGMMFERDYREALRRGLSVPKAAARVIS